MPGGSGAPLSANELELIDSALELVKDQLLPEARALIEKKGAWEEEDGKYYTTCVDKKACVFVVYNKDGIAQCSIEKAWHAGHTDWRKPISCHLFPVRVADFGGPYLHYEEIEECEDGRALGEREELSLIESLQEPLIRAFGEQAYEKLKEAAEKRI